jgi:hypothetical protein
VKKETQIFETFDLGEDIKNNPSYISLNFVSDLNTFFFGIYAMSFISFNYIL